MQTETGPIHIDSAERSHLSHRPDVLAVVLLFLGTLLAEAPVLLGRTVTGQDAATQFIPWYSFLGERLRSGDIPGWSPHQLAGAPFAADPQSGWTALLAMLSFSLLELSTAVPAFILGNVLLSGLFTYALGRALRLHPVGALSAALAYELSLFVQDRHACCWAYTGVITWLPLVLLGVERAIAASRLRCRFWWWGVTGIGLSQVLAAWLGQGSYYVLLVLGGYITYRTLLVTPAGGQSVALRARGLVLHGTAVLVAGVLFGAAGLLPRVEYNRLSNLAAGYGGAEQDALIGGWTLGNWASVLTRTDWHYAGVAVLALAVLGPMAVRARHAAPYFAVVSLSALVLSGQGPTPLHALFKLLPGFFRLHPHYPERVMTVFYLALAMLAGATVSSVCQREAGWRLPVGAVGLAVLVGLLNVLLPRASISLVTLLILGLAAISLLGAMRWWRVSTVVLLTLLCGDLLLARMDLGRHWPDHFQQVRLADYYAPTEAARFLRAQRELYRYFGYDPSLSQDAMLYRWQWADARAAALLVNNRAIALRLYDLQGYNPVHVARFDEYLRAMNGSAQEYRGAYVLPGGVNSPLLDALNVRYALLPPTSPAEPDPRWRAPRFTSVWEGKTVRVLENTTALPRAWVVHTAREVAPGEALRLLSAHEADPAREALLEEPMPAMQPPLLGAPASRAIVEEYASDRLRVSTRTSAPGLLVLSEVYYPAWRAYVDGKPEKVFVAHHVLRAVPIPAGTHEVELRYESATLAAGIALSLATVTLWLLLALLEAASVWHIRRRTR